ncbi:alpha-ketoacid dehydrogenase subunit beta [Mycolicibacterium sp. XJ662]
MKHMTYAQALNDALRQEMRRDPRVIVLGQDVAVYGGIFGATQGLLDEFGSARVVDTPISENGIVGAAIGMAISGLRPVVEIMYSDFLCLAMDSLANAASVFPFVTQDRVTVPLVVRTQGGPGGNAGPQHSKSLEQWTAHLPGIHTVLPSSPADAKGLLTSALRSTDPVIMFEHKKLYGTEGLVPDGEYVTPLGAAAVVQEGTDVSIIAVSGMVRHALTAAAELSTRGVSAEVIDVRSLRPLDTATLVASARKTGHVVVAAETWLRYGPTAEIAAVIMAEAFEELRAPVARVGAAAVPYPASPALEPAVLGGADDIVHAAQSLVTTRMMRTRPAELRHSA